MRSFKSRALLSIAVIFIVSSILIISCTSESATTDVNVDSDESLFQQALTQENSGNYSGAIQLYEQVITRFPDSSYVELAHESIPASRYFWGLQLEKNGQYGGEPAGGAVQQYNLILQEYPDSQYASMLKKLTENDTEIETIAGAEFDINSHFRGKITNQSSFYIVEVVIYVQLYQDINQVYYRNFTLNGIEPGEEKGFEETPWVPLHGWDNLIWSFTEVLLREE
jgi:tetratricopeptide (TPR) repeat protein